MSMKVAIVTSYPRDPNRPYGGVEAVSVVLVKALADLPDLDVHVVTTDRECTEHERSGFDGAVIHRLPMRSRRMLVEAIGPGRQTIQSFLRELEPDVVHAHDTYGMMVKGLDIPRVFTVHGFIHSDTAYRGGRGSWLRSRLWHRFETAGWADQPHIVSISPYVRERLAGVARGIIHDIDNPIRKVFFDVPRRDDGCSVFCAALICPRKNQIALIEAAGLLKKRGVDIHVRLAGTISDEVYGDTLRERVAALGLEENVHLLGSISSEQVRDELATASIFSLVSFEEGSPMGIEEAMAAGVPIVTSNRCGMPYMVRDGETGFLVDPHDPEDIAWRLEAVLGDDGLRQRMSEKANQVACERFHPDVVAQRTREVYRRAVRRRLNGDGCGA